jgi:two-component system, OmpR family, sensor histidine kinase KdpD
VTSIDEPAAPAVASPVEPRPAQVTYQDDPLRHLGQSQRRGDLRIYLGAAPGVGKTCAMLGEAHRRLERGTDVVAAVVETHGRKKVGELIKGIEVIPPHYISYRGSQFPEIDVEAVLRRKPHVALVDEYAHSNTPGSANEKRWQDIETLLDAGITVISTLNIQHLESLNDVVAQITCVEQRETVPDEVVRKAAQIELVDITPEALRRRLAHGNVYPSERIDAAMTNYFRAGNLTALREIALLWLADQVDAALAKYRADQKITDTWEARERVVVAVTGGPESETLVRRAFRIASKSSAQLMVVHVARGDGLSGVSPREMGTVRELAASIGATVHVVVGDDVSTALLDFARETNATQLVLGTSRRSRWARFFSEGIGAATINDSGKIDVHIVTHEQANRALPFAPISPRARQIVAWLAAIAVPWGILAVTTRWLDPQLDVGGKTAIFFGGVIAVALFGGVAPAVLAGMLSGALLVYYIAEPRYSFSVDNPSNAVTIVVLLGVAMAIAVLVDAAASRAREARRATQEAELLTLFAGSVLRGADINTLLERVREAYSQRAVCLVREVDGRMVPVAGVGSVACLTVDAADTAVKIADDDFWMLMSGRRLTGRDRRVLSVVATQAAGLVKQGELAEEAGKVKSLAEADELRRLLLSALGHDLRTPLTAAKAAVSSLRAEDVWFSPEDTSELLATVEESVDQLTLLVANLLDSSRLAAGVVRPKLDEVYLEEVVQRALVGIGGRSTIYGRAGIDRVKIEVGGTVAMGDPGLLERVLSNVIDNALRYAPGSMVRVNAGQVGPRVLISIIDEGPGVSKGAAEQMFQPFQRLGDFDTATGLGLGLSVAKGFVEAMGGTITASDTPGGGLTILIDLAAPLQERHGSDAATEKGGTDD